MTKLRWGLDTHFQFQRDPGCARGLRRATRSGLEPTEPARSRDRSAKAGGIPGRRQVWWTAGLSDRLARWRQREFWYSRRRTSRKPKLECRAQPDLAQR